MSDRQPVEQLEHQPLFPRISMAWFFFVAVIVAIALYVVRAADQGQAIAAAMVFTVVFFVVTAILSALCFFIAFAFGAMERAVDKEVEVPASPFIDGSPPEQIILPRPVDRE